MFVIFDLLQSIEMFINDQIIILKPLLFIHNLNKFCVLF